MNEVQKRRRKAVTDFNSIFILQVYGILGRKRMPEIGRADGVLSKMISE